MTLTTHDWAIFFTIAVTQSPNSREVAEECAAVDGVQLVCQLMAAQQSAPADVVTNETMMNVFRHLVTEHKLKPPPRATLLHSPGIRPLLPRFNKVHRWLENNCPEMQG